MNRNKLHEIVKRCEQAQKGPWFPYIEGVNMDCGDSFIRTAGEDIYLKPGASEADHEFIAAARQDIPELAKELCSLYENKTATLSEKQLREIRSRCELSSEKPVDHTVNSVPDNEFIINARDDVLWLLNNIKQFH